MVLKVFNTTLEAGKLDRALDLVERLHLEKSYTIAMSLAEGQRKHKLVNMIEDAKDRRFHADDGSEDESDEDSVPATTGYSRPRISPDSTDKFGKRPFPAESSTRQVKARTLA